jgi:hypothetical protein
MRYNSLAQKLSSNNQNSVSVTFSESPSPTICFLNYIPLSSSAGSYNTPPIKTTKLSRKHWCSKVFYKSNEPDWLTLLTLLPDSDNSHAQRGRQSPSWERTPHLARKNADCRPLGACEEVALARMLNLSVNQAMSFYYTTSSGICL